MTCMSCKLGYPINPKRVVAFCKISPLKCGEDKKMTDRGLQGIAGFTGVDRRLQGVLGHYRRLHAVTGCTWGYRGLQGVLR